MKVTNTGDKLHISSDNNVADFLKKIPSEIGHYQVKGTSITLVTVTLLVDGTLTRKVNFNPQSRRVKSDIMSVRGMLETQNGHFTHTDLTVVQIFSVRMEFSYQYSLADCTGREIVSNIKKDLLHLRKQGFVNKETTPGQAE